MRKRVTELIGVVRERGARLQVPEPESSKKTLPPLFRKRLFRDVFNLIDLLIHPEIL